MRLFLDTEFNGFGGRLISMGIVTEEPYGPEFYRIAHIPENPVPWVAENVLPVVGGIATGESFTADLLLFLKVAAQSGGNLEAIADWPADFEHLCAQMSLMGQALGYELPLSISMKLIPGSPKIVSATPHHALHDARALRDWYTGDILNGRG